MTASYFELVNGSNNLSNVHCLGGGRLLCAQRVVRSLTSSGFNLTAQTTFPNLTANMTSNSSH